MNYHLVKWGSDWAFWRRLQEFSESTKYTSLSTRAGTQVPGGKGSEGFVLLKWTVTCSLNSLSLGHCAQQTSSLVSGSPRSSWFLRNKVCCLQLSLPFPLLYHQGMTIGTLSPTLLRIILKDCPNCKISSLLGNYFSFSPLFRPGVARKTHIRGRKYSISFPFVCGAHQPFTLQLI